MYVKLFFVYTDSKKRLASRLMDVRARAGEMVSHYSIQCAFIC